jgi:PhnB protein
MFPRAVVRCNDVTKPRNAPAGWPTLIPRIFADEPEPLVAFIRTVFEARGTFHRERPTELRIGDAMLMVSGTTERAPMGACLYVYVEDADATYRRALAAGAASLETPRDLPYGDRRATVRDAWGNVWQIATHGGRFEVP